MFTYPAGLHQRTSSALCTKECLWAMRPLEPGLFTALHLAWVACGQKEMWKLCHAWVILSDLGMPRHVTPSKLQDRESLTFDIQMANAQPALHTRQTTNFWL